MAKKKPKQKYAIQIGIEYWIEDKIHYMSLGKGYQIYGYGRTKKEAQNMLLETIKFKLK